MGLGDNQGNTYTGREGVDTAFRLAYTPQLDQIDQAFINTKETKSSEKGGNNLNDWNEERPDFFWAHSENQQKRMNALFDWGTELMAAGVKDPTQDSRARDFQKEMAKIAADAKQSKAIEERYNKDRQIVLRDKKGEYTKESKQKLLDWYKNTPLEKIIKDGLLPPKLEFKAPNISITPVVEKLATAMADEAPLNNFVEAGRSIAADDPALNDKVEQIISTMPQGAFNQLALEAQSAGFDPNTDLSGFYIGKQAKLRKYKTVDYAKMIDDLADYQAGHVLKQYRNEKETGGGDTKTTYGKTKMVPFQNSLNIARSKIAMLSPEQQKGLLGKEYITYKVDKSGELERDEHGALIPNAPKIVRSKEDMAELIASRNALKNAYESQSGLDLQLAGSEQSWRGWSKKKKDDYDVWQQSLLGKYPEDGSVELRRANQQRAISWLNGLEIDGYKVSNGKANYYGGEGYVFNDSYIDQYMSSIYGSDAIVTPERLELSFDRITEGREDGYKEVKDADPYTIDVMNQQQTNTGMTRTWYSKQYAKNKILFKPATEEDIISDEFVNFQTNSNPTLNMGNPEKKSIEKWQENSDFPPPPEVDEEQKKAVKKSPWE